ncbi:hypothetical protein M422DRAFT_250068 [Sphaerobolus stellatus SS14]|nr:hypothetical protein M422DRAFT_250068 [Sphaerobolus stellatus SS14]
MAGPSGEILVYFSILFLGNILLSLLILTLLFSKSVPQGKNIYLLNFLITTYLATLPPSLLLITGNIYEPYPPKALCLFQAVLMDGLAPMFEVAFLILAINTWLEVRSSLKGSISPITQYRWLKLLLLFAPYAMLLIWSLSSLALALINHLEPSLNPLGESCSNRDFHSIKVLHGFLGSFMIIIATMDIVFEAMIVYSAWSTMKKVMGLERRPRGYMTLLNDYSFPARLMLLSLLHIGTIT